MINEHAAPLVIDIAQRFIAVLTSVDARWQTGYFRFSADEWMTEAKGSYVAPNGVNMLDVLKTKDFFHPVAEQGKALFAAVGKSQGLLLLIVRSNAEYEIQFDFDNLSRWKISKMDGGTGIPEGS